MYTGSDSLSVVRIRNTGSDSLSVVRIRNTESDSLSVVRIRNTGSDSLSAVTRIRTDETNRRFSNLFRDVPVDAVVL
jgi:hypothetical protein